MLSKTSKTSKTLPRSHYLSLNGLRFHYLEWSSKRAPTIVMLHGLRAYARTWDKLAPRFQDRFRVLALDQRGRGETEWDPEANYYTDAYLADLEAFVDALELERFILVGHSMGGTTAYVYTARHPDRIERTVVENIGPGSAVEGAGSERIFREMSETPVASTTGIERERIGEGCGRTRTTMLSSNACARLCAWARTVMSSGASTGPEFARLV